LRLENPLMRRRIAVLVSIVASLTMMGVPRALAGDDGAGADNIVSVHNQSDGELQVRARFSLAHDPANTVANSNIAYAHASCTDCRTVAVAVQVVLAEATATDVRPTNVAVAINENCLRCATFAFARQELLQVGSHVDLGKEAKAQIDEIEGQISDVASSSESFDQMTAELDSLSEQLVALVQREVDRVGVKAERTGERQVDKRDD